VMEWRRAVEVGLLKWAALPYPYEVHLKRVSMKVIFNTLRGGYTGLNTGFVSLSNGGGSEYWQCPG
jgi:ADP-ribosylglycohydrolase